MGDLSGGLHAYNNFQQACISRISTIWYTSGREGRAPLRVENGRWIVEQDETFHSFDVVTHSRNAGKWMNFMCEGGLGNLPSEVPLSRMNVIGEVLRNPRIMEFAREHTDLLVKWALFHDSEKLASYIRSLELGQNGEIKYLDNSLYEKLISLGSSELERMSRELPSHSNQKVLSTIGAFVWMEKAGYVSAEEKETLIDWHLIYEDMTGFVKGKVSENTAIQGKHGVDEVAIGSLLVFVDEIAKGTKENSKLDQDWARIRQLIRVSE